MHSIGYVGDSNPQGLLQVQVSEKGQAGMPTTFVGKQMVVAPGAWLTKVAKKQFGLDIPTRVSRESVSYWTPKAPKGGAAAPVAASVDHSYHSMPVFIPWLDNGPPPDLDSYIPPHPRAYHNERYTKHIHTRNVASLQG